MLTPTYTAEVIVGGTKQSVQFKAFPDSLINRQSGDVTIIYKDETGLPFDISSLSGSDFKSVPFDSGQTPVTLAVGVTGFSQEIFVLTTSGTAPTSGTFILRVAGENTAAIAYNADAATVQAALEALPSRTGGDFLVSLKSKENLSFAGAQILVETSGGFAIDFESTLDASLLLPIDSISLKVTQIGSSVANEYNATWTKDSIPASYSEFDFDKSGAIAFYIALEDGDDFYQVFQRLNIDDDNFIGSGGTIPSSATYVYNPNDPNSWLRITTSSPALMNEALDKIATMNRRDFGTVLSLLADPPLSPNDGDAYLVIAPATGVWLALEDKIVKWSATLAAWAPTNVHRDGDEILNLADDRLYRVDNLLAWVIVPITATDTDAIHVNVAGEIAGITEKVAPVVGDFAIIEDSEDSNNKKRILIGNLPTGAALPVDDTNSLVKDPVDGTRQMRIDVGAVGSAQTRVLFMPNENIDLTPNTGDLLGDVVGDSTPQLGGDLGTNGNNIDFGDNSDLLNLKNIDFTTFSELTISGGVITANQALHNIDTQADAATDDLDTITLGASNIIYITLNNALRIVTLKDGVGNLALGADLPMVFGTVYQLIYNAADWQLVGSAAAGGGSSLPVTDTTAIVKGAVTDTKLMRIDVEAKVAPATTRVLQMPDTDVNLFPQGRISPAVIATTDIDWDLGGVFDLGTLALDVTLTFSNIKQAQTIVIEYTGASGFDVIALPGSVTVLNGGTSTQDSKNILIVTSTDESTEQIAAYSTDTAAGDLEGVKLISTTTYTLIDADSGFLIYFTNVAGCTVSLNNGLATGFFVSLVQDTATSVITLAGTATLKAGSDLVTAVDNDIMVVLPRPTPDEYYVTV